MENCCCSIAMTAIMSSITNRRCAARAAARISSIARLAGMARCTRSVSCIARRARRSIDVPYAVLLVELREGPRMISTYVGGDPAEVTFEMDVTLVCEQVSDEITLPRFRRAG